jgi:site-specific DNA recombinase
MKRQLMNISKAAIYARVSSQKQKEGETIESQISALRVLALKEGYDVSDTFLFLDNGISGAVMHRPALDELRDMIKTEPLDIIFIYSPDRLSRNYTHQLILLEEFRRQGVRVHFLKSPPETDTPEAKMLSHFQGIFSEYERALILDRSRRGRIYKAKKNDPSILPSMPYGYKRIKTDRAATVYIVEEEAPIVKEIFRLYVYEGLTLKAVA